jgi:hypothetical protein
VTLAATNCGARSQSFNDHEICLFAPRSKLDLIRQTNCDRHARVLRRHLHVSLASINVFAPVPRVNHRDKDMIVLHVKLMGNLTVHPIITAALCLDTNGQTSDANSYGGDMSDRAVRMLGDRLRIARTQTGKRSQPTTERHGREIKRRQIGWARMKARNLVY